MKYTIGIDLGGMSAKAALFDENDRLVCKKTVKTQKDDGFDGTAQKLADLAKGVAKDAGVDFENIVGVGIASPGVIQAVTGAVLRWSNFDWTNVPLKARVSQLTGKPVFVTNDANAAALGEAKFGAGKRFQTSILVTLGTGIGGGIILGGKLFEGFEGAGGEIGHMSIRLRGRKCGCGREGCFEQYASATALLRMTREEMKKNKRSQMWQIAQEMGGVNGKVPFDAAAMGDESGKKVVEKYIYNLAVGLANLVNIFRPEAIVLGGGVSAQGENLFKPLKEVVERMIYVPSSVAPLEIFGAKLGNDAGAYGAYALVKENLA